MKFRSIFKVAAAVMAACGLMLTSCDEVKTEVEVFEISIKNPSVASGKGQQFVNVKCSGDWTLALVAETGEVDWARLSATTVCALSGAAAKREVCWVPRPMWLTTRKR